MFMSMRIAPKLRGWDISTATYSGKSKASNTQEANPQRFTLSYDGTKLYIVGTTGDTVYQYSLSTAFDISTAAYASKSFSVNSQEGVPQFGLVFSPDGLKMYILGGNMTVYQYGLSTAWDVSTASYSSKSKLVSDTSASPRGLSFSPDGSKMYIVSSSAKMVYQYGLATLWDVSTATYSTKSMSYSSQDAISACAEFSIDGTNLYVMGANGGTVFQYSVGTPFDVSTANYTGKSLLVTGVSPAPQQVTFSPDGVSAYVMNGVATFAIYQYSLR